jgi:murein lipoprotein
MKTVSAKLLGILAASGLLFGCATTQQQPDMSGELGEIRAIAEKAAADAAAARARADAAMDTASSAKAQSEETEAKIDRMFKKAMYK